MHLHYTLLVSDLMQEVLKNQRVSLDINDIRELVRADSEAVDHLILERLRSDVALINELGRYIINSGGKRLRPLLVLLAARACGYQGRAPYRTGGGHRIHSYRDPAAR